MVASVREIFPADQFDAPEKELNEGPDVLRLAAVRQVPALNTESSEFEFPDSRWQPPE